ncbi:diacylglycerol kinase [Ventosimonas gracilis]|uniref:Dihydrofolate reductase n=1 Tax=Ventosimonas gracilis TaxID=1680762 RepID=A0A139SQM0_9GAMM|nr:dihydrofolate reductase [Ventosimonas gracilis]KXU36899.1 diacylglycerol kinase [Ventosimonas gracilis]
MKPLALIAALGENRVIGRQGRLPWHLPQDLAHFKALTMGKPIIMGRKTWESIGRPLPGRLNLVISRTDLSTGTAEVFTSLEAARSRADHWAQQQNADEIMVVGGGELYRQALPLATRLYLTRVALNPEGDAFFPELPEGQWQLLESCALAACENTPACTFETWRRIAPKIELKLLHPLAEED